MAFSFEIDTTADVLRETWIGPIDLQQLKDSCLQEWAHPHYRRRMVMISDFREALMAFGTKEAVEFALWFGDKDPPAKHAIVVKREVGFGFAKMFATMSDAAKSERNVTKVFYNYEEAENWLGLPPKTTSAG